MLHLADLHIGVESYGRLDPETGLHTRLLDYLRCFDEAITLGIERQVDLVLIAGDIYKHRTPNPTHQREFAKRIGQLRAARIPVFILTGNHDTHPSHGRANSVEIFGTLAVEGVTIAARPGLHTIPTRSGPIQIIAIPWVYRQLLLTRDEMKLASLRDIEAKLRHRIAHSINRFVDELDPTLPAIITYHGTIDGAQVGAERGMTLGDDIVLPSSLFAHERIDYVALGHIHRHQEVRSHPPMVYAGGIERIDFGERGEKKGCVLVELERGRTHWKFHELKARPFVSVEVDVRSSSDPQERILTALRKQHLDQAIVRVEIKATRPQTVGIDERTIRDAIQQAGAFFLAGFVVNVEREQRNRFVGEEFDPDWVGRITPRQALAHYLKATNRDPERIEALLQEFDALWSEE